ANTSRVMYTVLCPYKLFLFTSLLLFFFFFFSSRRRHTRLQGDWSSDVCSSDLFPIASPWRSVCIASSSPANAWSSRFPADRTRRSEEHTSELQSPCNLVCRLLLEKKKKKNIQYL